MRGRHLSAWLAGIFAVAALTVVFRIDISAARYFESDAVVRDAFPGVKEPVYFDPSPFALWLPSDWFVWDSLRSEHLPLWERLQGGGYSPVITMQNGVFHPLRWIVALVPRALAPSVLIELAVLLAAWGMWLLLLDYGRSRTAAAIGSLLFVFSSPLLQNLHFSGDLVPLAHTPWIVLFLRRRNVPGLAVTLAMLLMSGHPLYVVTVAIAAIGFAVAESFDARSPRPAIVLIVATGIGAALAAFTYFPTIASMPDLWFYKTETHQGSVYALFDPIETWFRALGSMFIDLKRPATAVDDPEFWLYVSVPAAVLSAVGLIEGLVRARERVVAGVLLVFFMLSVPGIWMLEISMTKPLMFMNRSYFAGGMTFTLAVLAAAGLDVLSRHRAGRIVGIVCAVVAAAIYCVRAYGILQPRRWQAVVRGDIAAQLLRDPAHRVIGGLGQTHLPNSSRITGIEDVREEAPVWTRRKHLWWQAVDPEVRRNAFPTFRITDRTESPLIGDFNVSRVLRSRLRTFEIHNLPDQNVHPAVVIEPWKGLVRPRVHFADRVRFVHDMDEAAKALGVHPPIKLRGGLHVEERGSAPADLEVVEWPGTPPTLPEPASASATVRYPGDSSAVIDAESASGGLVVLHDTWQRGWQGRVDGKPAEIVPVNLISRGVMVGPGRHHIEMEYEPYRFRTGLGISVAGLLALGIACKPRRK